MDRDTVGQDFFKFVVFNSGLNSASVDMVSGHL